MNKRKIGAMAFAIFFLFALRANAQGTITKMYLTSPGEYINPGMLLGVELIFFVDSMAPAEISSYSIRLEYDTDYLTLENAYPDYWNSDWQYPMSSEYTDSGYADLMDQSLSGCSFYIETYVTMAHLTFRANTTIPPGLIDSLIHINTTGSTVLGCEIPTPLPVTVNEYEDALYDTIPFVQTTFGLDQYLDMDGNTLGSVGDGDIDVLRDIVLGKSYETPGQFTLKVGGLQGDINGNTEVDYYDLGYMDAVARTIRFIHAGPNGLCNSVANDPPPPDPEDADDIQEIPASQGEPHTLVIDGDTGNGVLESTPGGDDTIEGKLIFSGANGKAESTASGDDQQLIPYGKGALGTICVTPGDNGYLATQAFGDDVVITDPKPVGDLLNANPMAGAPSKIVRIFPKSATVFYDHKQEVPVTVSVQTAEGFPKLGLAPVFQAQGGGTFRGSGTNIVTGWVSDKFKDRSGTPSGNVTVILNPAVGQNIINVSIPGNMDKGVPAIYGDPITINVLNQEPLLHPNSMTLSADVSEVHVSEPLGLSMILKEGTTVAPGFANQMYLISQRNMTNGSGLTYLKRGNYNTAFYDDFEAGNLIGWTVVGGCGPIMVDNVRPGLFGVKSVHITSNNPVGICSLQRSVNTAQFNDLMVQFQWAVNGSGTGYIRGYWSSDGVIWLPLMNNSLANYTGSWNKMMSAGFNLSKYRAIENGQLFVRLNIQMQPGGNIYIDNFQVAGKHEMMYDDFQGLPVGEFPSSMLPAAFISTGEDGICQTAKTVPDLQPILVGNGKANVVYIYPGKDQILDSIPGGDDQLNLNSITTGANGIAETIVPETDFTIIPYGQGWPFAIAIKPSNDCVLHTANAVFDDERQNYNGPYPRILVDDSVTGWGPETNKSVFIGRQATGPMNSYAVRKMVDLESVPDALLSFKYMTVGMADAGTYKQQFLVEVSNNGGKNFVPIWDFAGEDVFDWTEVQLNLTDDPRFNVNDNFIIQWRATMNSMENDALDPDAVYIDDVIIYAAATPPDKFTPVVDLNGSGNYHANLFSLAPGNTIQVAAVFYNENSAPVYSNVVQVKVSLRKVDPNSIKILPEQLELKACKSQKVTVVGHYLDLPGELTEDITSLFKLVVEGPAKQTSPGVITMDCYRGPDPLSSDPVPFTIRAIPQVLGLLDPTGSGSGTQTGNISGRVYKPTYTGADSASIVIDMGAGGKVYSATDSSGYYTVTGVPVGTSYAVDGSKQTYTLSHKTSITVTAGLTTTVNPVLGAGANCDGDSYMDTSDTDDDNDGVLDTSEPTTDCKYKPDCDGDGYPDNTDEYPTNPAEWADSDDDGTGDTADTDDDNDTILDSEEIVTGGDGYITNKASSDTDADLMSDPYEISYGLNPTVNDAASDKDGDGKRNYDEYLRGTVPNVSEPACGEGAYCVADSDGNGLVEVPDLSALGVLLSGTPASWTQVIPQNGDQMDLDGNGIIEVPDYSLLLSVLVQNLGGNLPGQADAVNLESSQNVTISNGQWTKITVNLTSQATAGAKKRSGYGVIFYKSSSSSSGAGEFWGGDKASTSRSGGRWYTTRTMVSESGRAEIWFKATHTGHVYIQAEVPASASKYIQQVQLATPVHVTIN